MFLWVERNQLHQGVPGIHQISPSSHLNDVKGEIGLYILLPILVPVSRTDIGFM
jgi:hypothetical protein